VRGYPDDRAEAVALSRAIRVARAPGRPWSEQAVLVRTHAQTHLIAEALRESGIPHRVRGGAAFLDRPEIRQALRALRDARVPLGTALSDLEEQLEADGRTELDGLGDDDARAARLAAVPDTQAALSALIRMGHDYLRLDPNGRADTLATWLTATIQSEQDAAGTGRDAVDVATFHAAKGLEWATVHLAGVEDGFVPIAHARTAAAKAEEVRLLYVAMTRAERDLRITFAEQRTFNGRVVPRRPSPLIEPLIDALLSGEASAPSPDLEEAAGWRDELTRQRQLLRAATGVPPSLDALRAWRAEAARAARIDPEAVLPDHVLARVATEHPSDVEALGAVRGVGPILAHRFGEDILDALAVGDVA
jgi:DNA helicase-2/ATP-dependent DNA helicase PcrA